MKNDFQNKNIVITGGTSGLGRALAERFLKLGARVAIIARTQQTLDLMVSENPWLIAIQGDIANKKEINPIAGELNARLGEVDILMNVASYLGQTPLRLLADTECEDFEKVLQTNLLGAFRLTKALLSSMLLRGSGTVVSISSDAAVNAYATWGAYSVSKAASDHMARIFNAELEDQGIRFLAVDPGDMETPMHAAAIPDADRSKLRKPEESAMKIIELLLNQNDAVVRRSV